MAVAQFQRDGLQALVFARPGETRPVKAKARAMCRANKRHRHRRLKNGREKFPAAAPYAGID